MLTYEIHFFFLCFYYLFRSRIYKIIIIMFNLKSFFDKTKLTSGPNQFGLFSSYKKKFYVIFLFIRLLFVAGCEITSRICTFGPEVFVGLVTGLFKAKSEAKRRSFCGWVNVMRILDSPPSRRQT